MTQFSRFFLDDDKARWRAIISSWLAGMATAIPLAASEASAGTLIAICSSVSVFTLAAFVCRYSASASNPQRSRSETTRRTFGDYLYVYVGAFASVLFLLRRTVFNPDSVHAATGLIEKGIDGSQLVPEQQIASTRTALRIIGGTPQSNPTLMLADYSVVQAASAYNFVIRAIAEGKLQDNFSNNTFTATGVSTVISVGGSFFASRLTIRGTGPVRPTAIQVRCSTCEVVILSSKLKGVSQKLDTGTWFKCDFSDSEISYGGGRVIMFDCSFKNCTFHFPDVIGDPMRSAIKSGTAVSPNPFMG